MLVTVKPRPSATKATRRFTVQPEDDLVNALSAVRGGDVVTILPRRPIDSIFLPGIAKSDWVSLLAKEVEVHSIIVPSTAKDWELTGFKVTRDPTIPDGQTVYDLVNVSQGADNIALKEFNILGTPLGNTRRGLSMNGTNVSFSGRIGEIHEHGADSQCINGIHGAGPFLIEDYDLEGGAENILFGGGDPSTPGLIPSNITIRRGKMWKSPSTVDPKNRWVVKNLLELKNAKNVLVEDFTFRDFPGVAMVFTPRNQDGTAPWSTVQDVIVRNGHVTNVGSVLSGIATDNERPSGLAARIAIRNLLCLNINTSFLYWGSGQVGAIMDGLEISHVTALQCLRYAFWMETAFNALIMRDNLFGFGSYTQQTMPIQNVNGDIRNNILVNAGDLDGGGPSRNQGLDPAKWISCNPDVGIDILTGLLSPPASTWGTTDGIGVIGYNPPLAPIPPTPTPDDLEARVAYLEDILAKVRVALS